MHDVINKSLLHVFISRFGSFEGDFNHSTLASDGIMSLGIPESKSSLSDPNLGSIGIISSDLNIQDKAEDQLKCNIR